MSDAPQYLPPEYVAPIENQVARANEYNKLRKNTLQPIQSIFVNHLFESNMDIAEASRRTGIKVSRGREWVEQEGPTSELIGSRLQEMANASKVTVDVIVQGLYDEATRMPVHDEDKTVSHAARVSAWSHLAKFKGMFDKGGGRNKSSVSVHIDIGGNNNVNIQGEEDGSA